MNFARPTLTAAAPLDPAFDLLIDELLARLQSGEAVDWSAVEREHPEHAERLRSMVPALEALGELPGASDPAAHSENGDLVPGVLGDFRIFREVGRGGMGVVYEAEQVSLSRRVALKVLPFAATMDPKHLQRFKNEAKAAASLRHEHIVHVYGVGCERGVHYYAMEFIEGQTLAQLIARMQRIVVEKVAGPNQTAAYIAPSSVAGLCEAGPGSQTPATADPKTPPVDDTAPIAALSTERSGPKNREFYRTAAGLIAQAADALEHAHGLGIVHRDVKPANLLLDAAGKLYVGDFGLARVGTDAGLTVSGDLLGTLRYMAPEQVMSRHGLVDHRADIYGLGATLYELLTGRPAVDAAERAEMLRQIAFEEPTAPRKLDKSIPAELETITLKALVKNPNERYGTAQELADDLRRWLDHQTIRARRPSLRQRLDKWTRRHSAAVGATAAALLIGTAVSAWQAVRANAAAATERQAKDTAQKRLAQIEKVNDMLGSIFKDLDPRSEETDGKPLRVLLGERLDRTSQELDGEAVGDPLTVAKLQMTLGRSLVELGYAEKAIVLFGRARETYTAKLGPENSQTLHSVHELAMAYERTGKPELAIPLLEAMVTLEREQRGTEHVAILNVMSDLALAYGSTGRHDQELSLLEETLRLKMATLGPANSLGTMNNLGMAYERAGRLDKAVLVLEEVVKLAKATLGPEYPRTLTCMCNLAQVYAHSGKPNLAVPLAEEVLRVRNSKLGLDHPDTLISMQVLTEAYRHAGLLDRAIPLIEETLKLIKAKRGPENPGTLAVMNTLGATFWSAGKSNQAVPVFEETLRLRKGTLGPEHRDTIATTHNLAAAYQDAGQRELATPLYEESLRVRKATLGLEHPDTLSTMNNLALAYSEAGIHDPAIRLSRELLAIRRRTRPADDLKLATALGLLGRALREAQQPAVAEPLLQEALAIHELKAPTAWTTFLAKLTLGTALMGQQKYAEAEPLLVQGYEGMKQREAAMLPREKNHLTKAADWVVRFYEATNQPAKAQEWREKAVPGGSR